MARLHIVIDLDVDPTREDPHDVVDALLAVGPDLPLFEPGLRWIRSDLYEAMAEWVSAEWDIDGKGTGDRPDMPALIATDPALDAKDRGAIGLLYEVLADQAAKARAAGGPDQERP